MLSTSLGKLQFREESKKTEDLSASIGSGDFFVFGEKTARCGDLHQSRPLARVLGEPDLG